MLTAEERKARKDAYNLIYRNLPETKERMRRWEANRTPEQKERYRVRRKAQRALPEVMERRRKQHIKYSYDLTPQQWEVMFEKQGRCCAICRSITDKWHTDHCHSNDRVRGILCTACNVALGLFKDNVAFLQEAISYLTIHATKEK